MVLEEAPGSRQSREAGGEAVSSGVKTRSCPFCRKHVEAVGSYSDVCPSCKRRLVGKVEFIDGERTPDDDLLDEKLYE